MYAQNAAKLNQMNDEQMYNQLFELQEQVKAKKGIKPKTKQLANAYLPGGETGKGFWDRVGEGLDRAPTPIRRLLSVPSASDVAYDPKLGMSSMEFSNKMKIAKKYGLAYDRDRYGYWGAMADYANSPDRAGEFSTLPQDSYQATFGPNGEYLTRFSKHDSPEYKYWSDQTRSNLLGTSSHPMFPTSPILSRFGYRGDWSHGLQHTDQPAAETISTAYSVTPEPTRTGTSASARTTQPLTVTQPQSSTQLQTTKLESPVGFTVPLHQHGPITNEERDDLFRREEIFQRNQKAKQRAERQARRKEMWNNIGENFGDIVGSLSALPGIVSDLGTKPEKFDAVYNPYANSVRNVFANRRYDIDAAMEEARRNRAVSNYNANQFNSNTGANLAYRLQSARNYDDTVSKLRDAKNNAENQYKAEYANALNDLGRQWVASTNLAVDQNARSRAAARNIQRQGFSELAQLGQTLVKSNNERRRDKELLPLYREFLKAGFSDNDISLLMSNLPKSYRTKKK